MYYYADLYINDEHTSAQRWNFIIIERGNKGWAKAQLVRIDEITDGIINIHDMAEDDMRDSKLLIFRVRSKKVSGINTFVMHMPEVERGISVALIPTSEIIPLAIENVNPIVFYGNGLS